MNSTTCQTCGKPLPAEAPQGLCPACLLQRTFQDAPAPPPPEVELQQLSAAFPQLVIEEMIGQGGMGRVYRAQQPHLNRTVALKVLSAERANDPEWLERFSREARALARLSHPHIVQVYDFGETPMPYLLMEHVEGVNLRQAMQNGGLTSREALSIVPKLCDALQYAHEHGVLHRDIKPENILIDTEGRVKLADFGLAKLRDESVLPFTLTQSGAKLGTLAYMAPEQVEKPADVDHRADIYSLGVVLYEMLTGELPLGRFPAPSEASGADSRLDSVVMRTLDKKREKRPHSAQQLRTELDQAWSREASASISCRPRTQAALMALFASAGIIISITSMQGIMLVVGLMLSLLFGVLAAWHFRLHRAGHTTSSVRWLSFGLSSFIALCFIAAGQEAAATLFALLAGITLLSGWPSSGAGPLGRVLQGLGHCFAALLFGLLGISMTAALHDWMADGLYAPKAALVALHVCGLTISLLAFIFRLRVALHFWLFGTAPPASTGPWLRLAAAALGLTLTPTFPNWNPDVRISGLPVWQALSGMKPPPSPKSSLRPEAESRLQAKQKKFIDEIPIWKKSRDWISDISKAASKTEQELVLREIHTSLRSDNENSFRAALATLPQLTFVNFDRSPFREDIRPHLDSKSSDVRIAALKALRYCHIEPSDRARLDQFAKQCTNKEIGELIYAYKTLFNSDFTGEGSDPVLSLLERGFAAAQRGERDDLYRIDIKYILSVVGGSKISPEIESRLIQWSRLGNDEHGNMVLGVQSNAFNAFWFALSVSQNKSRASVQRLLELANHPSSSIARQSLSGMIDTVPDPNDRAYLAERVIGILDLRSDETLWQHGLKLLRSGATQGHLPALKELAARDTLSKERRDALQQIIQSLQKPQ